MNGWVWGAVALVAIPFLRRFIFGLHDEIYERCQVRKADDIQLGHMRRKALLDEVMTVYPQDGRMPLLFGYEGGELVIRNPDTLAAFSLTGVLDRHEDLERIDAVLRLAAALRGNGRSQDLTTDDLTPTFVWPERYDYERMLNRYVQRPSPHNLLLGVTYDEYGNETPVIGDMEEMIHLMIGGKSGYGKSNLEYVLAHQLVNGVDDCRLLAIDYSGMTMLPFQCSDRMLYPVATTEDMALAEFRVLMQELERRKELYGDYPGVQNLTRFNQVTGENLLPWYTFIDETAALTRNRVIQRMLVDVAERARKFGLGLVAAGTTFHAKVVPEAIRVCFATRAAVACSRVTSQIILEDSVASTLDKRGQCFLQLPGVPTQKILTPYVPEFRVVEGNGPIHDLDEWRDGDSVMEKRDRVKELLLEGSLTGRQICLEVYGYAGGHAYTVLREVTQELLDFNTPTQV